MKLSQLKFEGLIFVHIDDFVKSIESSSNYAETLRMLEISQAAIGGQPVENTFGSAKSFYRQKEFGLAAYLFRLVVNYSVTESVRADAGYYLALSKMHLGDYVMAKGLMQACLAIRRGIFPVTT